MMNILNTTDNLESRKRHRAESIDKAEDRIKDAKGASKFGMKTEEMPTPAYGSQEYWENRYKNNTIENSVKSESDPDPYHAWYFKFDDLAPILLPLIVGSEYNGDVDDAEQNKEDENDNNPQKTSAYLNGSKSRSQRSSQTINSPVSNENRTMLPLQQNNVNLGVEDVNQKNKNPDIEQIDTVSEIDEEVSDAGSYEEIEGYELDEVDDGDEDSVAAMIRVGLANNGPISVLEVGCGDAPLGQDLVSSIQEYGSQNGRDPLTIMKKIVCLDYSKNVIDTMKQEQEKQQVQIKKKGIPVHYEVGDARNLSYENESFEAILEKGTLDAMLSDSDGHGQKNCRKIVSECARVLTIGGYIIIISHLNAHVESGLEWLNNVIVPSLRATGNFEWLIEVHGNDVEIPSDVEDETEEDNDKQIESPGPAVYFIKKVGVLTRAKASNSSEQSMPTIPLKFFSY